MLTSKWLYGALLTELSAVLYTLGAVYMRKACVATSDSRSLAPVTKLLRRGNFWMGLFLRLSACLIWWRARCYAPDTTVAPLFLSVSFITNMACGPGILHEQYHSREVAVAVSCIVFATATSLIDKRWMDPWPSLGTWVVDLDHMCIGDGGALFGSAILWGAAFCCAGVMYVYGYAMYYDCPCSACLPDSYARRAPPIPVLAGLTSGATYFVGYIGFSMCTDVRAKLTSIAMTDTENKWWSFAVGVLMVFSVLFAVEGARCFDCRYFVPAYNTIGFFTATVMRVLLVHHRHDVKLSMWIVFIVIHILLLFLPFSLSWKPATIKLPQPLKTTQQLTPPSTPFLDGTVDPLPLQATPLLELIGEHDDPLVPPELEREREEQLLAVRPPRHRLAKIAFSYWVNIAHGIPAVVLVFAPFMLAYPLVLDDSWNWFPKFLVLYASLAVGVTALRLAVFSSVGRLRIRLCMDTDYYDLLAKGGRRRRRLESRRRIGAGGRAMLIKDPYDDESSSGSEDELMWQSVRHFVVVEGGWDPTSLDSCEELIGLLESIACSPMAETQVTVFLSAQMDEAHKQAIYRFEHEFRERVRFHHGHAMDLDLGGAAASGAAASDSAASLGRQPAVMPLWVGEQLTAGLRGAGPKPLAPGPRGAIGRTALSQILEHARRCRCREDNVLVTLTTPDASFPPGFWGALTCAFLTSGMRHTTIWQAPVFPLKDHLQQGFAVRHASFFLSQSQLASLSDPVSVPLPKSTCSLPLELLHQVDSCWDPDIRLPSHDWSTGLWTKCWLTTIGRCTVQPVFQPVLRRATRDRGCLPSGSLRVHSRGMLELVYIFVGLPLTLMRSRGSRSLKRPRVAYVRRARLFCLFLRSIPPICGVILAHVNVSSWLAALCFNGLYLLYYSCTGSAGTSGSILLGVTAQILGFGIFPLLMFSNAALISHLPPESVIGASPTGDADPADQPQSPKFRRCVNWLSFVFKGILAGPLCHFTAAWMHWSTAITLLRLGCMSCSCPDPQDGGTPSTAPLASSNLSPSAGSGVLHAGAFGSLSRHGSNESRFIDVGRSYLKWTPPAQRPGGYPAGVKRAPRRVGRHPMERYSDSSAPF